MVVRSEARAWRAVATAEVETEASRDEVGAIGESRARQGGGRGECGQGRGRCHIGECRVRQNVGTFGSEGVWGGSDGRG